MAKGPTVIWRDSWSNWWLHKGTARVWKGCRKLSTSPVGCQSVSPGDHIAGWRDVALPLHSVVIFWSRLAAKWVTVLLGSRESRPAPPPTSRPGSPSHNLRPACLPVLIPTCPIWQCLWPLMQHSCQVNSEADMLFSRREAGSSRISCFICFPLGRRQERWMRSSETHN